MRGLLPLRTLPPADALPPVCSVACACVVVFLSGHGDAGTPHSPHPFACRRPPPGMAPPGLAAATVFELGLRVKQLPPPLPLGIKITFFDVALFIQVTETRGLLPLRTPLPADAPPPVWRPLASLLLLCKG